MYADCFIDPAELPVDLIRGAEAVVTGTLGLACDPTATTMHRVVDLAKSSQTTVGVFMRSKGSYAVDAVVGNRRTTSLKDEAMIGKGLVQSPFHL